ncbi:MAG: AIM24 family protein [Acidimicrobiales bacterium]
MTATGSTYTCPYCRLSTDASGVSCRNCGAPVDIREVATDSGWVEMPPIRDMARIQLGQSSVQIEGTYVPVADFDLRGEDWVYFSHHVLLWTDPSVHLDALPITGATRRLRAGLPLVMMRASGPGHLALSDDAPGDVIALPLPAGAEMWVHEHRFLAATGSVAYDFVDPTIWYTTTNGNDSETHRPLGWYIDRFVATDGPGLVLVHSPGNTFVRDLAPGEVILVQPSALLYKDPGVDMILHFEYPASAGLSWTRNYQMRTVWLKLRGPGRVAIQSVFDRPEGGGQRISRHSPATEVSW